MTGQDLPLQGLHLEFHPIDLPHVLCEVAPCFFLMETDDISFTLLIMSTCVYPNSRVVYSPMSDTQFPLLTQRESH